VNELISIVVPVYNVEQYLEQCLKSIIAQTYQKLEILLIDDGSTDRSSIICDTYSALDSRIKVIHKANGGLSSARNKGLDISKGEYISFVDADDFVAPEFIRDLYEALVDVNAELAVCNCQYVDCNYNAIHTHDDCYVIKDGVRKGTELMSSYMFEKLDCMYTVVWNKLYKRNLLLTLRFPIGRMHEDEFISYKIIYNANLIACLSKRLYFYVQRKQSITSVSSEKRMTDKVAAFDEKAYYFHQKKEYLYEAETLIDLFFLYSECNNQENKISFEIKKRYRKIFFRIITNRKIKFAWRLKYILCYISPRL
jgi:glycosyltransferase involved in cell wall biosynthesis